MIDRKDFIKAMGNPDKAFENSVQQALDDIQRSERRETAKERSPFRYILPAAAILAAAACALFFIGRTPRPDNITMPQVMSQPTAKPTPEPGENEAVTPAPAPMNEQFGDKVPETTAEPAVEINGQTEGGEFTAASPEPIHPENAQAYGEEYTEVTPAPTPQPVRQGSLPEDHWMLESTLNIDVNSLYPGYTYVDTATDKSGNRHWMLSNGSESILGCCVSRNHITYADSETGDYKCPTLYVYMPNTPEEAEYVSAIMDVSAPWLKETYERSCAIVGEDGGEMPLNSIEITFNENDEPMFCGMWFGLNSESYILWMLNEDGSIEIIKLYSTPEIVPLDYDDPSDYDTMEVVIPDPVLEAAIRKELNWLGKLTPAKLSELTGLQIIDTPIESLEGLQYCTGLDWLELSGCGIDDDDLKYIGSLPALFTLNLGNNNITDITDLSGLDLGWLYLSGNNVSDLWPISGMTNLYELYLDENQLSGTNALKPITGLTGMRRLYMNNCGITDASLIAELAENAPALEALFLYGNPIEDYTPIKNTDIPEIYFGE